ncbi:4Fe-4S single cluster domain-containing protein [Paracoccus aminovorans]|uniref:4Fe-4S single cluster domain-containing protein n=1 Tax=Paracoccus aminovorans TaxID=34004 RepID=A0A1I3B305_9RHOB|nr:ferredoxin [Paracoccus aminovorans]CQR87575.1 ferredoxin [Paracoccus aminovorans]SFH56705.1 4Fe-4S single cluster domain-containing protein [Paracoccus aminovorans]
MVKVKVDMDLCEFHGQCVFIAPEVFRFEGDDLVWTEEVPEEERARVERAAKACPQLAIRIE